MKTRKELELEDDIKAWKWLVLALFIVAVFFIVDSIIISNKVNKLETQLSECQEQVPVWALKVKYQATNMTEPSHCAFNRYCIVYWDDYRLEKNFSSYQDYENALKEFKNMCKREYIQNCEVLK